MHRFSSSSRSFLSFMASAPPCWWPPALAQPVFPLMAVPNLTVRRVSPFSCGHRTWNMDTISRLKGGESGKSYRMLPISCASISIIPQGSEHSAVIQSTDNSEKKNTIEPRDTIFEVADQDERSDKDACRGQNVSLSDCGDGGWRTIKDSMAETIVSEDKKFSDFFNEYPMTNVLARSRHRDGSIYRNMDSWWKKEYHIANRNETGLEAMMLSDPADCRIGNGFCRRHTPCQMLQIFSLELAEIQVDGGLLEVYGYVAVRDDLDPFLNYIVNFSRDDPIIVEQGSLITMTGPKRGIKMSSTILIEYDMRIKVNGQEKDDLQLIDGVSMISDVRELDELYILRIPGDCGVIEVTFSHIDYAVEATIEVLVSKVQSRFNLSLFCLTSGLDEEIQVFDGAISESCSLKRSVVAVVRNSLMELEFEVGTLLSVPDEYRCCFKAKTHGHDIQNIKTHFALISVKVTWSTLPHCFPGPTHYDFKLS